MSETWDRTKGALGSRLDRMPDEHFPREGEGDDELGPRERLKNQLARTRGYRNYDTAHDAVRQDIDADAEEILYRRAQREADRRDGQWYAQANDLPTP